MLTIFYDGQCPLCSAEMSQLKRYDHQHQLCLEDLHQHDFAERYPHIDPIAANKVLHGQLSDGQLVTGLDVTCLAWKTVGKHAWLQALRWPLVRPLSDAAYRFFAQHRQTISQYFKPAKVCKVCHSKHCDW